jgi:hypothetical protein
LHSRIFCPIRVEVPEITSPRNVTITMQQHHHRSTSVTLRASCNHTEEIYRRCDKALRAVGVALRAFLWPCCSGRFLAAAQYLSSFAPWAQLRQPEKHELRYYRNGKRKQLAKNCALGANPKCPWNYPDPRHLGYLKSHGVVKQSCSLAGLWQDLLVYLRNARAMLCFCMLAYIQKTGCSPR